MKRCDLCTHEFSEFGEPVLVETFHFGNRGEDMAEKLSPEDKVRSFVEEIENNGQTPPHALELRKFNEGRGKDFVEKNDGIHFSMERHQAVGIHLSGTAMNNMLTRIEHYLFTGDDISIIGEELLSVDLGNLAWEMIYGAMGERFDFSLVSDGKIMLDDPRASKNIVSSLEEALAIVKKDIVDETFIGVSDTLSDNLSEKELEQTLQKIRDEMFEIYEEHVVDEVTSAWWEFLNDYTEATIQDEWIICLECRKKLKSITSKHLARHGLSTREYREKYDLYDVPLKAKGK